MSSFLANFNEILIVAKFYTGSVVIKVISIETIVFNSYFSISCSILFAALHLTDITVVSVLLHR